MSKPIKRRTLRDVAKAAGVSEMTVSRVLRDADVVSNRTKTKVLKVVGELGYVQNHLAGSLATSRSNLVAVIIPSLQNDVFTEVVSGITDALEMGGYNPVVGISDYDLEKEERLVYSMMSWRPSGFILPNRIHTKRTKNILANASVPVVQMMNLTQNPIDFCVGLDQRRAGHELAQYVIARGARRFGFIGWNTNDFSARARFEAIKGVATSNGATVVHADKLDRPASFLSGKESLARLLQTHPDCDAIFFSNDSAAMGGLIQCMEMGIKVPSDLAILGFSGLESGQNMPRPLTTILTKRYEIGRLSARTILNALAGQKMDRVVDVGFELITGKTA